MFVPFFLLLLIILFAAFYTYRRFYVMRFFQREGIPGPSPHWLLGNMAAFADEEKRHLVHPQWTRQYGKVYGVFDGVRPMLITSDCDIINQVFVKQFHDFHAHKEMPFNALPGTGKDENVMMFSAKGERWKRLRTIANPMFSAGKLRGLAPLMQKCQSDFMDLIDKKAAKEEAFDISQCFKLLTLDTISETAFGVELNSAKTDGTNNPLFETLKAFFGDISDIPLSLKLAMIFPSIKSLFRMCEMFRAKFFAKGFLGPRLELMELMKKVINTRRLNGDKNQRQDLLQMMLDVECESLADRSKYLTTDEIIAQAMLFMLAGFETSSNALAFTSFLLANNPHVQDKLTAEIDAYFNAHPNKGVDQDSVCELGEYLECVISEALRLYPVGLLIINRQAMEDTTVNGIRIPRGVAVQADVWSVHRDEEQWGPVDPNLFHPERFQKDYPTQPTRSSTAFLPFGFGPRMCIGMRFAMLEMKLALVNLLRKYRIEKTSRTGDELKLRVAATIAPKDGVWVKLAKRR